MSKTPSETLTEVIAAELITYLGAGTLNETQLTSALDYTDLNIESLERLKQLHFVLHDDVRAYVEALPKRLRRIKTQDTITTEKSRGEIRGAINWPQTIEQRSKIGFDDPTVFVVENPAVEIDIPANRVVKKLLSIIAEPLREDLDGVDQSWRTGWDERSIARLERTLKSNVYLEALPSPEAISITDRDVTSTRRARQPLYQEGADLYRLYTDLINDRYQEAETAAFLQETLIQPADHDLFDLFCLFALLRYLRQAYDVKLTRIKPGGEAIARFEGGTQRIEVYYDAGGPLSFFERYPSPAEIPKDPILDPLRRQSKAYENHAELIDGFLSKGSQKGFFQGRPDVVVLQWEIEGEDRLSNVLLCEFKYTSSEETFSRGLRELLEYIQLAREGDTYLFEDQLDSDSVYGLLCTDSVETEMDQIGMIRHWTSATMRDFF